MSRRAGDPASARSLRWIRVVLLAQATLCTAAAVRATGEPSLAATLAAHCREREATSTLRTRFAQTRTLAALGEVERSSGVLFYRKPDSLRWQYSEPDGSWIVIRGQEGWAVFPRIRQVHRLHLRGASADGILTVVGFGACGPALSKSFEITMRAGAGGRPVLSLVPLRPDVAAQFTRIELALDRKDHLPRTVVLHESTGDTVRLEFSDFQRGVTIEPSLLEFTTPKGYAVVP